MIDTESLKHIIFCSFVHWQHQELYKDKIGDFFTKPFFIEEIKEYEIHFYFVYISHANYIL